MIGKYKLKNGDVRYRVKEYIGTDSRTGELIFARKRGFKTKREAELFILREKNNFEKGIDDRQNKRIKFDEAFELWSEQYKQTVKPNTYDVQLKVCKKWILPTFGKYYLDGIDVAMCQKVVNEWYRTYSKSQLLVSIVNRIFKFAINLGYVNDNPMANVIRPRNTHRKEHETAFYDKDELVEFLSYAKEDLPFMDYLIFHLLGYTGVRKAELIGLKWQDIDFRHAILNVERVYVRASSGSYIYQSPKTKKSKRKITLDKQTMHLLNRWHVAQTEKLFKLGLKVSDDTPIFTSKLDHPITLNRPNKKLKDVLDKHNLPKITIHGFRHTHCCLLFEAGASMKEVQDRLGHASIKTTLDIYTHVTDRQRDDTADKFANFMSM